MAVIPAVAQGIPVASLLALLGAILASSVACVGAAAAVSLRSDLLPALRNE